MKRLIVIIGMLLMAVPCLAKDVSVQATVGRNEVAPGESLSLTVEIKGDDGDVDISGIRDFDVVSQSSASNISIINGHMSKTHTYTYVLLPKKTGHLLIPPLPVTVGRKTLYTEMVPIEVSTDADGQATGGNKDLFAEIVLSDNRPYLGEQLTARLKIYNAVSIAGRALQQEPAFDGFTVEKLDGAQSYTAVIAGRRYQVVEVVYVLVPEKTGQLTVGPAAVGFDVLSQGSRANRSPFDSFFNTTRTVPKVVQSKAVPVTVRPLPDYNGPGVFSGLVGQFNLTVDIDETNLAVGDSANLTVTVNGKGNIREAPLPDLGLPEDAFKVYKEDPVEDVSAGDTGISGSKRFVAALVPLKQGQYRLGPFSLNYFDIDRERYITVQSEPIMVKVGPAAEKNDIDLHAAHNGAADNSAAQQRQKAVKFTGKDIFPLKTSLAAVQHHPPVSIWWFVAGSGLPFLLYGIAVMIAGSMQKDESAGKIMARQAREALKAARTGKSNGGASLDSLYRSIVYGVYARVGRKGESLTYREARALLENCGCEAALVDEVCNALETIEQARYGGRAETLALDTELLATVGNLLRRLTK